MRIKFTRFISTGNSKNVTFFRENYFNFTCNSVLTVKFIFSVYNNEHYIDASLVPLLKERQGEKEQKERERQRYERDRQQREREKEQKVREEERKRRDAIEVLRKEQKNGMPEDVVKDGEEKMQKSTDKFSKLIDEVLDAKEKEILTV